MAPEPIEQVVRIVAKSEVDAGLSQARQQFRDLAGETNKAFSPTIPRLFGSEVGKTFDRLKGQLRTLQPLFGTFRQVFAGFTVFGLVHQGLQALVDVVVNYVKSIKEADEASAKLGRQMSVLGKSSEAAIERFRRTRDFLTSPATGIGGGRVLEPGEATSQASVLAGLSLSLQSTDRQVERAQRFAIALKDLGIEAKDAQKALEGFIRAQSGQGRGFKALSDVLPFEVTPENFANLTKVLETLKTIDTLNAGGGKAALLGPFGGDLSPAELKSLIAALEKSVTTLGFRTNESVDSQIDAIRELSEETDRSIRKQKELDDAIRRGRGTPGEQIQLAVQDATKLVNIYSLASQSIDTITQGLHDVTSATVAWAVAGEGGALKLRSLLAGIAGQLAGIITQYIFLRILAGAGAATLPSGGPSYPSNFIGPIPAGGGGAPAGLRGGGGSYNAGLRGGGPGPSSAGGGGDGNLVVVDDGQAWFNRRLVAAGGLVLQLVQAGKSGNPGFRNGLRSRLG